MPAELGNLVARESDEREVVARNYGLAMLALAIGGFTIGTTEFATMGVLPQVADGVHVSIPAAGHIISSYALGVVVGVPVLSYFAVGLPRKGFLLGLMAVYSLFNLVSAVSTSYWMLMVARFFDGLPHGAYFGTASLVAASMSAPRHRGRAVAMVMLGLSVANVLGVPAATWLGEHVGWRAPYFASAVLAIITVVMVMAFVPRMANGGDTSNRSAEGKAFFSNVQVWLTMAAGAIGFGGLFASYSYIAKTVTNISGLSEDMTPFFVAAFGLGMVVGTWLAGELARWSVMKSLLVGGAGSIVMLIVYWALAPYGWWFLPGVFMVTFIGSVLTINLQIRLMDVSGNAVTLGAAMNHAALNIANALGAYLGGVVIDAGYGYRAPALVGAGLAAVGTIILVASALIHRQSSATFPLEERV